MFKLSVEAAMEGGLLRSDPLDIIAGSVYPSKDTERERLWDADARGITLPGLASRLTYVTLRYGRTMNSGTRCER